MSFLEKSCQFRKNTLLPQIYDRVRKTISLALKLTLIYSIVGILCMEFFPEFFVSFFTSDIELITLACPMLQVYIFGAIIMGANSTFQQTYNSLGEGKKSFFFAFYRKIIILIPLIFILPMFLENKIMAVVLAEPISDLLTTITNAIHFQYFIKKKLPVKEIVYDEV